MKKILSVLCILCALCVLTSGLSLAEGCGIGDAAYYGPSEGQHNAAPPAAAVNGAVQGPEEPAGVAGAYSVYANDNSVRGFVYRLYTVTLGREPDPAGFNTWVSLLETGSATAADLVLSFMDSPEYKGLGKNNTQIVTDCYKAMLNRNPDADGLSGWQKGLDVGMTFRAICAGVVGSPEFVALAAQYGIVPGKVTLTNARDKNYERTALVYRLYKDCLLREPDLAGLENWCKMLENGMTGTRIASGFVFSKEYKGKMVTNEEFVEMLYRTFLGREPEAAGKNSWVNLLDYTSTREHLLNGFMASAEFIGKCLLANIQVGKAIYEPDNERAWKINVLILSLVNSERAKYGLAPLKTREDLWEGVAMVRAGEVKKNQSHTRPDGTVCWTAYTAAGFLEGVHYLFAGENIAWGYKKESDVFAAWMNSPGHRENILRASFTTLATGLFGTKYWSMNFMQETK